MLPVRVGPGNDTQRQQCCEALWVEKESNDWEEEMTDWAHPMVALQLAAMEGVTFTGKLKLISNSIERD